MRHHPGPTRSAGDSADFFVIVSSPTPIIVFQPTSGLSDQTFHIFHCTGADHVGDPADPTEASTIEWRPVRNVIELIRSGDITDGLSLTALTSALALGALRFQS
ncbi:MAG: hypothetical protein ACI8RE_001375 [Ilumatobacter sp.]